jgi:uncharacterized HNH endonuclease L245
MLPPQHYKSIADIEIRFYPSIGIFSRMEPVFQTPYPLVIEDDFACILNEPGYAISKNGTLMDIGNKEIFPQKGDTSDYVYTSVGKRRLLIHRMVALAWIYNTDIQTKYVVNHLDGNKSNNSVSNLEWTDYSGNTRHAIDTGLLNIGTSCKVREISTGKIYAFSTITDMCSFIGVKKLPPQITLCSPKNAFNGYEIRLANDDRPWYYAAGARHIYRKAATIQGPYIAYDFLTALAIKRPTLRDISKETNIPLSTVARLVRRNSAGYKMRYNNWHIGVSMPAEGMTGYANIAFTNQPRRIVFTDTKDGTSKTYSSITDAERMTGVTRKTIRLHLKNGQPLNSISIKYIK